MFKYLAFHVPAAIDPVRLPAILHGVAIYYEMNNKNTISDKVKSKLEDYNFIVSARSLYLRHKVIKKIVTLKFDIIEIF